MATSVGLKTEPEATTAGVFRLRKFDVGQGQSLPYRTSFGKS